MWNLIDIEVSIVLSAFSAYIYQTIHFRKWTVLKTILCVRSTDGVKVI